MTNQTIKIVDLSTGKEEVRAMNADELASFMATQEEQVAVEKAFVAKQVKKQEVLDKLGLTSDEVIALFA